MLRSLGLSLGLTLLLELPAALLLGIRRGRDVAVVALVNVVTNPVVVLVLNLALLKWGATPWHLVAILEIAAVAVEGLLYRGCLSRNKIHPFLFSLILNSISYLGGLLLR